MTSLFRFEDNEVRTVIVDGEPWFVARDVALALGFRDSLNFIRGLDRDQRGTHNVSTLGGGQTVAIVDEAGLYELVLRSRKPSARRFVKWVTREVLPELRKTGLYVIEDRAKVLASARMAEWKDACPRRRCGRRAASRSEGLTAGGARW